MADEPALPDRAGGVPAGTDKRDYPPRPIVGIGVVVLREDTVLLVRRGKPPNLGAWTIPGGAQELGETAEETARRELLEETGVTVGPLHLAANVDNIDRDEAGGIRYHYTIIDFAARWLDGAPRAGSDVLDAAWVKLDQLGDHGLWHEALRVIGIARRLLAGS